MNSWIVISIGALAQILFSSRLILQWLLSEKHKKILTPALFWEFSLLASFLLFVYGYLRNDFAIMLGQTITYYIYIRNMQLQHQWQKIVLPLRILICIFPFFILWYGYHNGLADKQLLFHNQAIPAWLLWLGIVSQVLFTFRFIYQWLYSEKRKESHLPLGFWVISLSGSLLILTYAVIRKDPVLLAGHLIGFVVYLRNIIIIKKNQ